MYDNEPKKIQKEITRRDVFGVSDHFQFTLTASMTGNKITVLRKCCGVQNGLPLQLKMAKIILGMQSDSEVSITDVGLAVEIPPWLLRFSRKSKVKLGA
jgi:hypothetical protein